MPGKRIPIELAVVRSAARDGTVAEPRSAYGDIIAFGPFQLRAAERLLEKDGVPLKLGSRALDILIALVYRAPGIVSKRELLARAWPDLIVDEGSLRFHIAALRKVLGEGKSGCRYVTNVAGRGYCFAAPVFRPDERPLWAGSLRAGRAESLGVLTGAIAHDFNNILGAILGYGELAQNAACAGDPTRRYVDNIMNAIQAMKAGGALTVSLDLLTLADSRAFTTATLSAGEYIRLLVRDSGIGIEPDVLELAVVQGIVNDLGGAVDVESEPGRGSVFTVLLPIARGS